MDINEEFEQKASLFRTETDIWPPGKDMPRTMCEPDGYETRHKAFVYWCKAQAESKLLREAADKKCSCGNVINHDYCTRCLRQLES